MWKFALILLLPSMTLTQTPPSGGPYVLKKQVIATGGATASAAGLSVRQRRPEYCASRSERALTIDRRLSRAGRDQRSTRTAFSQWL